MSRAAHDSALLEHMNKAPGLRINHGLIRCFLSDWYPSHDLHVNGLPEGTDIFWGTTPQMNFLEYQLSSWAQD